VYSSVAFVRQSLADGRFAPESGQIAESWIGPLSAKLGNPTNAREAAAIGRRSLTVDADAFAANVLPIVESLRASGVSDLRGLAAALNSRGVRTARGGRWHVSNVKNVIDRARDRAVL
jgi:hypothetical protein